MKRAASRTIQSDAFGFFGAIAAHVPDPAAAYAVTAQLIAQAVGCEPADVGAFLDSRQGRLFADDVAVELGRGCEFTSAVDTVIGRWQDWRMSGRGRIKRDSPFLAGIVQVESQARRLYMRGLAAAGDLMTASVGRPKLN